MIILDATALFTREFSIDHAASDIPCLSLNIYH